MHWCNGCNGHARSSVVPYPVRGLVFRKEWAAPESRRHFHNSLGPGARVRDLMTVTVPYVKACEASFDLRPRSLPARKVCSVRCLHCSVVLCRLLGTAHGTPRAGNPASSGLCNESINGLPLDSHANSLAPVCVLGCGAHHRYSSGAQARPASYRTAGQRPDLHPTTRQRLDQQARESCPYPTHHPRLPPRPQGRSNRPLPTACMAPIEAFSCSHVKVVK